MTTIYNAITLHPHLITWYSLYPRKSNIALQSITLDRATQETAISSGKASLPVPHRSSSNRLASTPHSSRVNADGLTSFDDLWPQPCPDRSWSRRRSGAGHQRPWPQDAGQSVNAAQMTIMDWPQDCGTWAHPFLQRRTTSSVVRSSVWHQRPMVTTRSANVL